MPWRLTTQRTSAPGPARAAIATAGATTAKRRGSPTGTHKGFCPVYQRRCESCHGPIDLHERYEWGGKWSWINLSRPEWSPALTAHLAQPAGGRGLTEKDFGTLLTPRWTERRSWLIERWSSIQDDYRVMQAALATGRHVELFRDTQDSDYQAMLQSIRAGQQLIGELPEADMPGFVNRSAHMSFGGR